MGLTYLYNNEYCYLFHLDILQSLYYKMMQQTSIDIMVICNVNPCIKYITYRIRPAVIYFILRFHNLIWNSMQTLSVVASSLLSELKMLRSILLSKASISMSWPLYNDMFTSTTLVGFKRFGFVPS